MKRKNKMKVCNTCGFENSDSAEFCQNCFSKLEKSSVLTSADNRPKTENEQIVCDNCFQVVPSSQSVCQNCGSPVSKQKQTGYTAPAVSSKINNGSARVKLMERNRFSTLAGICLSIVAIYGIVQFIMEVLYYPSGDYFFSIFSFSINLCIAIPIFIGFKPMVLIVSGLSFGYELFLFILMLQDSYIFSDYRNYRDYAFVVYSLFFALAFLAIIIISILSLFRKKAVSNIWFVGSGCMLISMVAKWIIKSYFKMIIYYGLKWELVVIFKEVTIDVVMIIGFLFIGLWLKECNYLKE